MKFCIYTLLTFAFSLHLSESAGSHNKQDTVFNQTDSKGLKQGYWKKYYPNGNLMYKGCFRDDKPTGEMTRYYQSGSLKAIMTFNEKTVYAEARFYYEDGTLASDGYYAGSKKDSVWNYYSYYDKKLKSRETYKNGLKHGFSYEYYPGGSCFEKTRWKNDLKDGVWEQYYEDGTVRLRGNYLNGRLSGTFVGYYPNNRPMVKGLYENNKREGTWVYFSERGDVSQEIAYSEGQPLNEKELTKQQQEFFRIIEENIGKYHEPSPTDFLPRNSYQGNEY